MTLNAPARQKVAAPATTAPSAVEVAAQGAAEALRLASGLPLALVYRPHPKGGYALWSSSGTCPDTGVSTRTWVDDRRWIEEEEGHWHFAPLGLEGRVGIAVVGPAPEQTLGDREARFDTEMIRVADQLREASILDKQDRDFEELAFEFSAAAMVGDPATFRSILDEITQHELTSPEARTILDDTSERIDMRALTDQESEPRTRLFALAALCRAHDASAPSTRGHHDRVTRAAVLLARRLRCEDDVVSTVAMAGQLHDIGRGPIGRRIMDEQHVPEQHRLEAHTRVGAAIAKAMGLSDNTQQAIRAHHERWDGSGTPDGFSGHRIPLAARILAVCEAYDELTTPRPWREAFETSQAAASIGQGAGYQFDPQVVAAFLETVAETLRETAAA